MKIEPKGERVEFYAEDGRQMFEVCVGKDGRSITIRSVNTCKVGEVLYSTCLQIEPQTSNSITVRTREWE